MSDRDFLDGLNLADRSVRESLEQGLAQAGLRLMNDAVMEEPAVPLDEGTLRGSGSVFVNGAQTATSSAFGAGTPAAQLCADGWSAELTFGMVSRRGEFLRELVQRDPSQRAFIRGWTRRLTRLLAGTR